jgi:hypothetical protein
MKQLDPIFKFLEAIVQPTPMNVLFAIFVPAPIVQPPPIKQLFATST